MKSLFSSIGLAFSIIMGSFRLLRSYPKLIMPLFPVFLMALGVEAGILFVNNLFLQLFMIFLVAFALMFSFTISTNMIQQIHEEQKPSLSEAVSSSRTMSMIPKVFMLSLIWFTVILILVVIELIIDSLLNRDEAGGEGILNAIFGTIADALRLMGFMLIPIMMFEDVSLLSGFKRLKTTLSDSPITALSGLALTKLATSLIFLILMGTDQLVSNIGLWGFILQLVIIGIGWTLSMYLEQLFVTGLYLYTTFPQSKVVGILLEKHLGQELPEVPVPEIPIQPATM